MSHGSKLSTCRAQLLICLVLDLPVVLCLMQGLQMLSATACTVRGSSVMLVHTCCSWAPMLSAAPWHAGGTGRWQTNKAGGAVITAELCHTLGQEGRHLMELWLSDTAGLGSVLAADTSQRLEVACGRVRVDSFQKRI